MSLRCADWLCLCQVLVVLSFHAKTNAAEPAELQAFLKRHCVECHDADAKSGGLDLTALDWQLSERLNFDQWVEVFDRVRKGEMPPPKEARPDAQAQTAFLKTLQAELHAVSAEKQRTSGRTVLRRLNRVEYENSLHDLLKIDVPLKELLPEDTPAQGFDTVAEGLRISQLQIEKYLEAADIAIDAAIQLTAAPETQKKRMTYKDEKGIRENLDTPEGFVRDPVSKAKHQIIFRELPDAVVFFSDGYSPTDLKQFHPRGAGTYRIRVSGYGFQSKGQPVMLRVYASNYREKRLLGYFDMPPDNAREIEFQTRLADNEHLIVMPYGTGFDDQGRGVWQVSGPKFEGIGLAVQWVEVEGPLFESWPPPSVKELFGDVPVREIPANKRPWRNGKRLTYELAPEKPRDALRSVVERFATRAFRRPLEAGEADGFAWLGDAALESGKSFEEAVRIALRGVLTAPQFLLFEERPGPLEDGALASRLSYFLWSAPPDDELLKLAAEKRLTQPNVLKAQVDRLLDSPKSAAFVSNFVGQWLDLRNIDATSPDMRLYPEFDEMLKGAMVGETEAFFEELLKRDLPVSNFIQSDFAMLNRRIAEHYGINGVVGEQFQSVALPTDSPRGGVLTQASVLKVTANGTVTSPVLRGAWVMKRLLGQTPPPPPPVIAIEPDTRGATTIREQLAKHRTSETCNSCHRSIDPPGFALENFDVIGGWRERYRSIEKGDRPTEKLRGRNIHEYKLGPAVDASGELSGGETFKDIRSFKTLLLTQREQVLRCIAENLLTYGTGAGVEFADRVVVDDIVKQTNSSGGGLRTLVHHVVQSPTFRSK